MRHRYVRVATPGQLLFSAAGTQLWKRRPRLTDNGIMKNVVLVLGMLATGCMADDESGGEWPCRSVSDDGADRATYEYDADHNITREINVGAFPFTATARWSGNVPLEYIFVGAQDHRFDYRMANDLDSDGHLMRRLYKALGTESGESYEQYWQYAGDHAVGGHRIFEGGRILQLTYEYAGDVLTVSECESEDFLCDTFTYAGDPRRPRRYEADYGADGLDYRIDYEYDANGLVTMRDSVTVGVGGTEQHERRDITRRPYGAPEREVVSGSYSQVLTYEFCSESP